MTASWIQRPPCTRRMEVNDMKYRALFAFMLFLAISSVPASAANRFIVRDSLGLSGLQGTCLLLGCSVTERLDGSAGTLFLVTTSSLISPTTFLQQITGQLGVVDAEPDLFLNVMQSQTLTAPAGLSDSTPVNYYGTTVWNGYA